MKAFLGRILAKKVLSCVKTTSVVQWEMIQIPYLWSHHVTASTCGLVQGVI